MLEGKPASLLWDGGWTAGEERLVKIHVFLLDLKAFYYHVSLRQRPEEKGTVWMLVFAPSGCSLHSHGPSSHPDIPDFRTHSLEMCLRGKGA